MHIPLLPPNHIRPVLDELLEENIFAQMSMAQKLAVYNQYVRRQWRDHTTPETLTVYEHLDSAIDNG